MDTTAGARRRVPGAGVGPGGGASDAELVARTRGGDRGAYDALVRRHLPDVVGLAVRLVGSPEDAEDLAQEAFVRAHRGLAWFRAEGSFAGWMRRIVVHLARDRWRRRARRPLEEPLAAAGGRASRERGPDAELSRRELQRHVADALVALPERLRTPLVLRALEGLDYAAIADALGVTPSTARTHVLKARRRLLAALGPVLERGER